MIVPFMINVRHVVFAVFLRRWRCQYHFYTQFLNRFSRLKQMAFRNKPAYFLALAWPFTKNEEAAPPSSDEQLNFLMKQAIIHIYNDELQDANSTLHELLTVLQDLFNSGQLTEREFMGKRARVYSEMANVGLLTKELPQAESLLKACIQDCLACGLAEDDRAVLELSLKLAILYEKMEEKEKSYAGFHFILDRHERKMQRLKDSNEKQDEDDALNDQALLGMVLNYYGKFLHKHHQTQAGLECLQRALRIARQLYGSEHPNVVHLLNDVAVLQISAAQYHDAEQSLREGIQLCEHAPSGDLLACLVPLYVNMAHLSVEQMPLEQGDAVAQATLHEDTMRAVNRWCDQARSVARNAVLKGSLCEEAEKCLDYAKERLAARKQARGDGSTSDT